MRCIDGTSSNVQRTKSDSLADEEDSDLQDNHMVPYLATEFLPPLHVPFFGP